MLVSSATVAFVGGVVGKVAREIVHHRFPRKMSACTCIGWRTNGLACRYTEKCNRIMQNMKLLLDSVESLMLLWTL